MKQLALLLCFFLIWQAAFSQTNDFAPVGATWYFRDIDGEVNYPPYYTYGYNKIESTSEVLIDGILCHELESVTVSSTGETTNVVTYYTYEDSGKVYFYSEDRFKLLYDFSGANWYAHDVFYGFEDSTLIYVDSITYEMYSDELLKTIYVHTEPDAQFTFPSDKIVEILGSTAYLFLYDIIDDTYRPNGLRCYFDDSINYIADPLISCDTLIPEIVAIGESHNSSYKVFLQGSNLNIAGIAAPTKISLLSMTGQRFLKVETYNDISIQIDNIPKGFYIVLLETDNNIYSQKITMQ